jgi:hypothetical protein
MEFMIKMEKNTQQRGGKTYGNREFLKQNRDFFLTPKLHQEK